MAENKLKKMFYQELSGCDGIKEIVDKVISNYEVLQEENKMLMKERELYGESNIKLVVKENEDMRIASVKLKELNKQMKIQAQQTISDMEKVMIEKSQLDSKEIV